MTRAQAIQPSFTLTSDNAATIAAICTRLDGIPLALELAASRISVLSPQALLVRLNRRLPFLRWNAPDLLARQQTLRATIDWSYDLLTSEEQVLFRRLAVFVGGWSLAAAEFVTAFDTLANTLDVLDGISALRDKGLVQVQGDGEDAPRFSMLETIREYATERLYVSTEADSIGRRHMGWYLMLAEKAAPHWSGPEQAGWLSRLEKDGDNLRAALRWSVEHSEVVTEARLCAALWQMWIRGYLSEGQHWMKGALTRAEAVPPALRARLYNGAASIALLLGDYEQAETLYSKALILRRSFSDAHGVAYALNNLGMVAIERGDLPQAAERLEESVSCFRRLGNAHGTAFALNNLGRVMSYQNKDIQATVSLQEALTLWHSIGNRQGVAETLYDLGQVAQRSQEYSRAASLYQESLSLLQRLGNERRLMASCLEGLAAVAGAQSQGSNAARLLGMAEMLRIRIGAPLAHIEHATYDQTVSATRELLGQDAFTTLWAQGRATPLAEIDTIGTAAQESSDERLQTATEVQSGPTTHSTHKNILSSREAEVLQLMAAGLSNKEIGERLFITVHTAKYHVTSILNKLGADTRTQAVVQALQHGLL
jgi:non-specific serine/threonine protein kinase